MLLTVAETPAYIAQAAKLLTAAERQDVVLLVASDPTAGVLIPGTGGLRKVRVGIGTRGKRGGGRVIYWYHSDRFPAVLLWVLDKAAASDLTAEQTRKLKALTRGLLADFGGR